jgi:hypothetical protein
VQKIITYNRNNGTQGYEQINWNKWALIRPVCYWGGNQWTGTRCVSIKDEKEIYVKYEGNVEKCVPFQCLCFLFHPFPLLISFPHFLPLILTGIPLLPY